MKFKKLEQFDIRRAMSYLEMPELGPKARILLKPATQAANPQYYDAMLAKSGKRMRRMARTETISSNDALLNLQDDRELYPLFVIAGWEFVEGDGTPGEDGLDDNGHVVFNRKHAQQLCAELPDHLMDQIRNHASTPERFYDDTVEPPPEASELAGNSAGDSSSS